MKLIKLILQTPKILLISVLLFLFAFSAYFYVQTKYLQQSEQNYINAIHNEVELLIKLKQNNTFQIAQSLSIDKKLITIMQNKQYDKLYDEHFFTIAKRFKKFKHLWLHIVDAKGINRYFSWRDKNEKLIGKQILKNRTDLKKFYKHPHPMSVISVGVFDITFKAIMPIYGTKHQFLGIVELISHFNSIARDLEKEKIYSALVIDKRFTKQLIHPFSKVFIDNYNISTLNLNNNVRQFLNKYGIHYFLNSNKNEIYQGIFQDNYFVTKVDIVDVNNNAIAYYLIFIKDKKNLQNKEILLQILTSVMALLFLLTSYYGFKTQIINIKLIASLNQRVKEETDKNLSLIYNDQLTGSYTKEKFLADREFYKNKELVMLNIKNFSQINATYSFEAGDEILRLTVLRLQTILKKKIYRIDSDEFIFISDEVTNDVHHINQHFNDDPLHVTKDDLNIRIAFSFAAVHGFEKDSLRKLTIALKQAKREPYKEFIYYKEEHINNDFLKFNSYLYDAIFTQQNARILPYFQAIRNNKTNKIIKYESLARLEVNGKIYSPYYFITIAQNSGFLIEITKIMIDKSFAYLSQHSKEITMSINITEDDLHSKKLKAYLLEKLAFYRLDASQIVLEILEGVSAGGAHNNIIQLKELKEIGFKLAIDDFGVEYSNFERINELDVDFIKIDGKYIKTLDTNHKSYKIAKAISEFASSMDIKVIAEFVENEAIQKVVEEIGIEFSQGYYFSIPSPTFLE